MSEQEIADLVVRKFEANGWEVFHEVAFSGKVIDMVAVKDGISHIVEVKTSLGLSVLAQADYWMRCHASNLVSVAVPWMHTRRSSKERVFAYAISRKFGIGVIEVKLNNQRVDEIVLPLMNEIPYSLLGRPLLEVLREEQKDMAKAGSASGGHYTDFKATRDKAVAFVEANTGCTVKELATGITHHYDGNASGALLSRIRQGEMFGIRVIEGRPLRLRVEEDAKYHLAEKD